MSDNTHNMTTRSKVAIQDMKSPDSELSPDSEVSFDSEVDENGNLKDFVVDDESESEEESA